MPAVSLCHIAYEDLGDGVFHIRVLTKRIMDQIVIAQWGNEMLEVLQLGAKKVVLDFAGVDYLASAGIGCMLGLTDALEGGRKKQQAKNIVMLNLHEDIYEVFEITKLTMLWQCFQSLDAALEALRAP